MSDNPEIPLELVDHSYDQVSENRVVNNAAVVLPVDLESADEEIPTVAPDVLRFLDASTSSDDEDEMSIVESTEDSDEYNSTSGSVSTQNFNFTPIINQEESHDEEDLQNEESIEQFDIDLPAEHSYFGATERVSGVKYFEPNQVYRIEIYSHHTLIYPGETYPMIMEEHSYQRLENTNDGMFFGLVFPTFFKEKANQLSGVICQIYEKGTNNHGNITIKSRVCQRFQVCSMRDDLVIYNLEGRTFADIKILPEIVLHDPLQAYSSLSLDRLQCNKSMYKKLRYYRANLTIWPKFLYDQYDVVAVMEKIEHFLETLNLHKSMPKDPSFLSFWLARHIPLQKSDQITLFKLNSATQRILHIGKTMNYNCNFCCASCGQRISAYKNVFIMSKHGFNTSYCNTTGYVHQTITVYTAIQNNLFIEGHPSTEYSWFPGYAWQIANCTGCHGHIGWRFSLPKGGNLSPKFFYGLSGRSVTIKAASGSASNRDKEEAI